MRTPTHARRPMPTGMRRWLRTALAGSLLFGGVSLASVIAGSLPASATALCATGFKPQILTATYGTSTFTGLFCVNAKGVGTYTQGTVSGIGTVVVVNGTTIIGALGKNLALVGATKGTTSGYIELAPAPIKLGTFTLSLPTPTITTTAEPTTATAGTSIADQASVSGGDNPTGTVTFNLYSNATATSPALFTDTESLVSGSATSAAYTATAPGTDYWVATYNGDANDNPVTSGVASEPVTINPATPLAFAGPGIDIGGFWIPGFAPCGTVSFALEVTGGVPPYTFSSSDLFGWTLTSTGVLTGSPGDTNIPITVVDSTGASASTYYQPECRQLGR